MSSFTRAFSWAAISSLLLLTSLYSTFAQNLKPSIGLSALPTDSDPICDIPWYLGDFDTSGLQPGDTAYDFTLYDRAGNSFNLDWALQQGKPVLMVTGSWTCPVFRNQIQEINDVQAMYGNDITTIIVYTVEAHPTDTSPYFGVPNPTNQNLNNGITYTQPTTYGERKVLVKALLDSMQVDVPVYIDGPCNKWWSTYGPAPQNATLVNTDGTVYVKHDWFDKYPNDIFCDIDSLLGSPCGGSPPPMGTFDFAMTSHDTVYGEPSTIINAYAMLYNNSAEDVLIEIRRFQNNLAPGWETSMCVDACLPTEVDTTSLYLAAGDSHSYTMYFYTDKDLNDTSSVRMGFRNVYDHQNFFLQWMFGITQEEEDTTGPPDTTASIGANPIILEEQPLLSPNPFTQTTTLRLPETIWQDHANLQFQLYDLTGSLVHQLTINQPTVTIERKSWAQGMYLYTIRHEEGTLFTGKVVLH